MRAFSRAKFGTKRAAIRWQPLAILAAGGLLGLVGSLLWNDRHPPVSEPATTHFPSLSHPPPEEPPTPPSELTPSPPSQREDTPRAQARADLERIQLMFSDFRTRMKENPVGTNAEIMQAVMGANPVGAHLGPPEGQTLNEQGELLDLWGTPYFFHQLSKDQMEVHSAGPDRVLGTRDDVFIK